MAVQKFKPTHMYMGRVIEQQSASLFENINASIDAAREQVGRSIQIVAHSQELMGRTRQSLARANDIRQALTSPAYNPIIDIVAENTERR